jgi:hypothetical protein
MKHIITALALVASTTASAEFFTGNDLHERIQSSEPTKQIMALGYIAGVADLGQNDTHCTPTGASLGQLRDIVKQSLVDYPSLRHMDASLLVASALMQTWPCEKKGKKI